MRRALWLAGSASMPLAVALAQQPPPGGPPPVAHATAGRPVSFIACPEFRDTARQCFVAEYGGKTYYIGGFRLDAPPQLMHRVLVEGTAYDSESSCGAINIEPVHLSVFPEIDPVCNTILPDNGSAPREGSQFDAPPEVLSQIGAERPQPLPLASIAEVSVHFPFGSAVLGQSAQQAVESAYKLASVSRLESVIITGWSSNTKLDDGRILTEDYSLAMQRAKHVHDALIALGLRSTLAHVAASGAWVVPDGVHDADHRKVVIVIRPMGLRINIR